MVTEFRVIPFASQIPELLYKELQAATPEKKPACAGKKKLLAILLIVTVSDKFPLQTCPERALSRPVF